MLSASFVPSADARKGLSHFSPLSPGSSNVVTLFCFLTAPHVLSSVFGSVPHVVHDCVLSQTLVVLIETNVYNPHNTPSASGDIHGNLTSRSEEGALRVPIKH